MAIWLPAGIGLATIPSLRATLARWKAEDDVLGSAEHWQSGADAPFRRAPEGRRARARLRRPGPHRSVRLGDGEPAGGPPIRLLVAVAVVAGALYALVLAGVVELPDFPKLLRDLSDALGVWTYALVGALAFLETGAFIGLVAPGETALALGGVVAASGEISLAIMIPIAWLCAFGGDVTSFLLGRRLGTPWLDRHGARFGIGVERREGVQRFLDKHGPRAILIGRFIGIVRAVAPFLYGSSGMTLRTFLPWSILGTGIWATAFTLVGYLFSESFEKAADTLAHGRARLRGHRRGRAPHPRVSATTPRQGGRLGGETRGAAASHLHHDHDAGGPHGHRSTGRARRAHPRRALGELRRRGTRAGRAPGRARGASTAS